MFYFQVREVEELDNRVTTENSFTHQRPWSNPSCHPALAESERSNQYSVRQAIRTDWIRGEFSGDNSRQTSRWLATRVSPPCTCGCPCPRPPYPYRDPAPWTISGSPSNSPSPGSSSICQAVPRRTGMTLILRSEGPGATWRWPSATWPNWSVSRGWVDRMKTRVLCLHSLSSLWIVPWLNYPDTDPSQTLLAHCWVNVGPASATLDQHSPNDGLMSSCLPVPLCTVTKGRWSIVVLMLIQRLWQWTNINPTSGPLVCWVPDVTRR